MKYVLFSDISKLHAENVGIAILNPGWSHPRRNLDTSVLILGKKAHVEIEEDGEPLDIIPDGLCLLTAGHTHVGRSFINEQCSYYWIHFKSTKPPEVLEEEEAHGILNNRAIVNSRLANALLFPKEFHPSDAGTYRELFHELLFEQEQPSFTPEKFQLLFRLLMVRINESVITEHIANDKISRRHSLVYSAIRLIFENLTDPNFSVKTLADMLQYNPNYIERLFKSIMCRSIEEYLIDQRIQYSVNCLIEKNDTVEKIAFNSGFGSKRNFIRQFIKRKGLTPAELRLRYRTMHITNR